ncbi:GNAT family N-acetyltransferase [Deinococcus alpinitundrae]|uniref:GNAT family N-acetyltransferase n=1 Tax=Deinococcus alpinitundrae TaxID=468913 RepID=UPI00137A35AD|nr:GNAT family N-acetyltransferase [Deinococcus alpinitundrae]
MLLKRLQAGDREQASALFTLMAEVFDEEAQPLSAAYLNQLLNRETFWAIGAFDGEQVLGGVTAHTLPMTRNETAEIFIYDLAVDPAFQRQGIGRRLISELRTQAAAVGINVLFVPADNEDLEALEFYRALGAQASPVTFFTFDGV